MNPVRRGGAVLAAGCALAALAVYPVFRLEFLLVLAGYAALLQRLPAMWLAALPLAVPALELAHWSGRLFLEDIDIFFAVTLAILLWRSPPDVRYRWPRGQVLAVAALGLAWFASLASGLFPWRGFHEVDVWYDFLGEANALRLGKSLVWAALFAPFIAREFVTAPERARNMVVVGMLFAASFVGLHALWERGVWTSLFSGDGPYAVLGKLLDFSTPYRVTGSFAEMNTGGEAIDGFVGLVWPMAAAAVLFARGPLAMGLAGSALGLSLYTLVTTFSRGLYFSLAVVGGVLFVAFARYVRTRDAGREVLPMWRILLACLLVVAITAYAYQRGGHLALAGPLLVFLAGSAVSGLRLRLVLAAAGFVAAVAVGVWLSMKGLVGNRWHPLEPSLAWPLAAGANVAALLLGAQVGRWVSPDGRLKPVLVVWVLMVSTSGVFLPAMLGTRMSDRMSTVATSLDERTAHWLDTLGMQTGGVRALVGMGQGSFPREYYWNHLGGKAESTGNYQFMTEGGNVFLRTVGSKDMRLGQRLSLPANEPLVLSLRVRALEPEARVKFRLCRRFVVQPFETDEGCVQKSQDLKGHSGEWQTLRFDIDTHRLWQKAGWFQAPVMLELNNRRDYRLLSLPAATVDFDDVSLTDRAGRQYIANGDFQAVQDRWLPYYDFSHLPWHIKNLWVHLYFEQGILGVLAFGFAMALALMRTWRAAGNGDLFGVGVGASLCGFVAVGTFGSPIDAPRVAWLFYFLWFVLAASQAVVVDKTRRRRSRSPTPSGSS